MKIVYNNRDTNSRINRTQKNISVLLAALVISALAGTTYVTLRGFSLASEEPDPDNAPDQCPEVDIPSAQFAEMRFATRKTYDWAKNAAINDAKQAYYRHDCSTSVPIDPGLTIGMCGNAGCLEAEGSGEWRLAEPSCEESAYERMSWMHKVTAVCTGSCVFTVECKEACPDKVGKNLGWRPSHGKDIMQIHAICEAMDPPLEDPPPCAPDYCADNGVVVSVQMTQNGALADCRKIRNCEVGAMHESPEIETGTPPLESGPYTPAPTDGGATGTPTTPWR